MRKKERKSTKTRNIEIEKGIGPGLIDPDPDLVDHDPVLDKDENLSKNPQGNWIE